MPLPGILLNTGLSVRKVINDLGFNGDWLMVKYIISKKIGDGKGFQTAFRPSIVKDINNAPFNDWGRKVKRLNDQEFLVEVSNDWTIDFKVETEIKKEDIPSLLQVNGIVDKFTIDGIRLDK